MATVFLVSESPNHNTTGALRYGDKVVAILAPMIVTGKHKEVNRKLYDYC